MTIVTTRLLAACATILGLLLVAGCNIIGPAAYIIEGQPEKPAAFELDPTLDTVVFIDDNRPVMSPTSLRLVVARDVSTELQSRNLVGVALDPRPLLTIARQESISDKMSIQDLAASVNANQVIYVRMENFQLTVNNRRTPTAVCEVRVLNMIEGRRVFPDPATGSSGYQVVAQMRDVSSGNYESRVGQGRLKEALAKQLAVEIARTFYEHVPDEIGTRLDGPR
ncbi:MAG: hypothetical protein F6K11_31630 [Leptolyngbya sp. SIO3F4]|nr:hypothetical protein [Leptolyngbya sp. SIO3F4]